ncbi:MAG: uracil-DNA glycosylase [Vicinamibacterales bacterium]
MTQPGDLLPHLRFYAELGVNGISRDPGWRERTRLGARDSGLEEERLGARGLGPEEERLGARDSGPEEGRLGARGLGPEEERLEAQGLGLEEERLGARGPRLGEESLESVRADIGDCTRCILHTLGRRQVVFGDGNPNADLMFVGEAPGADEDAQGVPFVGRAGQLLTKIIEAISLTRDDVYIANVIKCRPPGNRNPEPIEVATCNPFLQRQISVIRPKVIVALGTFAAQSLLQTKTPISKLRGQVHEFRDGIKVIPTFHPSFLLRNQKNRDLYRDVWEDMKKARAIIDTPS